MEITGEEKPALRLLVVIASYGEKNIELLRRIIARYRSMTFRADVVVVSNAPKDLGPGVEVVVGLPTKDPWSLPFAHKPILAARVEPYDLFAYSEDDMEVTEENIRAFLRVTPQLAPDEIAGYLRYEVDKAGNRSLPDVHHHFRWKPESVQRRGAEVVAEFTNEHAAFYLLTRDQLKRAVASGGFVRAPAQGRHDLACTAATDPYTRCGFRKVVCISDMEGFLIHHASNRYSGSWGPSLGEFEGQIRALFEIGDQVRSSVTLCEVEPKVLHFWAKSLYEKPGPEWLAAVPKDARTVLSIGCGSGEFEAELKGRGAEVTALALDAVIGTMAERRGIQVIYATLDEGWQKLKSRQFDCVIVRHLLHLLPDPIRVIQACSTLVRPGGSLLLSGPNFNRLPVWCKRVFRKGDYGKLRSFEESGINLLGPVEVTKMLEGAGFRTGAVRWLNHAPLLGGKARVGAKLGGLTAQDWMLDAVR